MKKESTNRKVSPNSGISETIAFKKFGNERLSRRQAIVKGGAIAAAGTLSAVLLTTGISLPRVAAAQDSQGLSEGDESILRFLSAAEILETDFWQQYNELGGIQDSEVPGGSGSKPYTDALAVLDMDMPQYIHDNTEDEFTHFTFINSYLTSKGWKPVILDEFRTLTGSKATGATSKKRLTNLKKLTIDTGFWNKYRSRSENPDFGDTFPHAVPDLKNGEFPAIPRDDGDLKPHDHIQAIANTVYRGRRYQPLPITRSKSQQSRGLANLAQHRSDRDNALPDLTR
jgi:hypothetical protein